MKLSKSILFIFLVTVYSTLANAQLAMGTWQTHIAYNSVDQLTQAENKIFATSDGALFSINKIDGAIEPYSKLNGLNDTDISKIEFDSDNNILIIAYSNGNIDLLSTSGVSNIPDLFNKQMSVSKGVNDVTVYNNLAYLSCDFGIMVLNLKKKEISDTYFIGVNGSYVKVLNTVVLNGKIYAAGADKIYTADITSPNLVNYEYWQSNISLPGSGEIKKLSVFNNHLILYRNDKIYTQDDNNNWSSIFDSFSISYMNISGEKMYFLDSSNQLYLANTDFTYKTLTGINSVADSEFDSSTNTSWFAALSSGVITYTEVNSSPVYNTYKPDGPAVNSPWSMAISGKKLIVVPGGRWSLQNNTPGNIMIYENNKWKNIYQEQISQITNWHVLDFVNVAIDPSDNSHFFVTSFGNGLFEFRNDAFYQWYSMNNSPIETAVGQDFDYMRVDGAIFDKDGNLFFCNMWTVKGIKVLLKDGTWTSLSFPDANKPTFGSILIRSQNQNQKWVPSVRYAPGIFIFDDNGTITDQSDDKSIFLSTFADTDNDGSNISPVNFYCLAEDKNGVIWAGTEQGPLLFYNPENAFNSGYTCSRIKIPRNDGTNLADYLLVTEKIKCIAIDGANRKWIGTQESGVYLMSENGQETIKHFTTNNSPLLSNDILSISINPTTGEVFIGTSMGLISYQGDAADAGDEFNNVHAYPNPVRENYNGIITITGLVADTNLKITDITGNLVYQTISNGSIATWDGKDVKGNKVNTGVYIVICVNEDGSQNSVAKIMVIN